MRRYLAVLLGLCGVVLATVLTLNLIIGARALGSAEGTRQASVWQEQTRGVTYAPPAGNTRPFKALRLADRLPSINAVVLGSSTVMGLTEALFPPEWRSYNMAVTGNVTGVIAAEAAYIERHFTSVRHVLVGLDWSVGNIYGAGGVGQVDLSADFYTRAYDSNAVPLIKRIEDALSWPRVTSLGSVIGGALKSDAPMAALRGALFDFGGREYRCPDNAVARDFDLINRGLCRGYRYDGSWTFANDSRLSPAQAATLSAAAAAPSSKYTRLLCSTDGTPNAVYLDHLAATAKRFKDKGGEMIFLLPPLVPGLEAALMKHPRWKPCLEKTKTALAAWAQREGLVVIDAGAAERAGCSSYEFADEHHAYPECNARILQKFFAELNAGQVQTGLYAAAK